MTTTAKKKAVRGESMTKRKPMTKAMLRGIGRRPVMQIVPTLDSVRPVRIYAADDHELVNRPLASPTGPGAAQNFHNVAGSQLATPQVTNVYLGQFWGDRAFVEGFSKAIVENGYLDPLRDLGYGTGPGNYLGPVDGPVLQAGSQFQETDAQNTVRALLDAGTIQGNVNSLFVLILPDGVTAFTQDGSASCSQFCGFHDAFDYNGTSIAYAVLPASLCTGCGGDIKDFTAVYAHELAESATDKVPGQGWVSDDGQEDGDLEAWILFGWGPPEDPNRYTIQGYYTNERGNTVGQWRA
jgi:hypothetical protein